MDKNSRDGEKNILNISLYSEIFIYFTISCEVRNETVCDHDWESLLLLTKETKSNAKMELRGIKLVMLMSTEVTIENQKLFEQCLNNIYKFPYWLKGKLPRLQYKY